MKQIGVTGHGNKTRTVIDEGAFKEPLQVATPHGNPIDPDTLKDAIKDVNEPHKAYNRAGRRKLARQKKGR